MVSNMFGSLKKPQILLSLFVFILLFQTETAFAITPEEALIKAAKAGLSPFFFVIKHAEPFLPLLCMGVAIWWQRSHGLLSFSLVLYLAGFSAALYYYF